MKQTRQELIQQMNMAGQRQGNQLVLLTNAISARVGLSATEFECFSLLWERGPLTAGQLARLCGLSTGGVTGLVDRLEKAGFARRVHDASDRRRVLIEALFDQEAAHKVRKLYEPVQKSFDQIFSEYNDEELQMLVCFLNRCNDTIEELVRQMQNQ